MIRTLTGFLLGAVAFLAVAFAFLVVVTFDGTGLMYEEGVEDAFADNLFVGMGVGMPLLFTGVAYFLGAPWRAALKLRAPLPSEATRLLNTRGTVGLFQCIGAAIAGLVFFLLTASPWVYLVVVIPVALAVQHRPSRQWVEECLARAAEETD